MILRGDITKATAVWDTWGPPTGTVRAAASRLAGNDPSDGSGVSAESNADAHGLGVTTPDMAVQHSTD